MFRLTPIGEMRYQVTVQAPTAGAASASGTPTVTWAAIAGGTNVWARIKTLRGRELERAQQIFATTTIKINIRWLAGVTAECRVVFGSRVFYVNLANDMDQRGAEIELDCTETPP